MARRDPLKFRDVCVRFWTGLLQRSKGKTTLFEGRPPSPQQHLECRAGTGMIYAYTFGLASTYVCLYIQGKKGMDSKTMFDLLRTDKEEIEKRFGHPLGWQRLDHKMSCRIRWDLQTDSVTDTDQARWPQIQDQLIDAMIRLERALRPYVNALER